MKKKTGNHVPLPISLQLGDFGHSDKNVNMEWDGTDDVKVSEGYEVFRGVTRLGFS